MYSAIQKKLDWKGKLNENDATDHLEITDMMIWIYEKLIGVLENGPKREIKWQLLHYTLW